MIIPDPDPGKTFQIRPDPDPQPSKNVGNQGSAPPPSLFSPLLNKILITFHRLVCRGLSIFARLSITVVLSCTYWSDRFHTAQRGSIVSWLVVEKNRTLLVWVVPEKNLGIGWVRKTIFMVIGVHSLTNRLNIVFPGESYVGFGGTACGSEPLARGSEPLCGVRRSILLI